MERTIKSPDRITTEFDLLTARQYQREYEELGELTQAAVWAERVDELLVQWAALSDLAK